MPGFFSIINLDLEAPPFWSLSLSLSLFSMAHSSLLLFFLSQSGIRVGGSFNFRGCFFIPTCLALITCLSILFHISTTSTIFIHPHAASTSLLLKPTSKAHFPSSTNLFLPISLLNLSTTPIRIPKRFRFEEDGDAPGATAQRLPSQRLLLHPPHGSNGKYLDEKDVFHDREMFMKDYNEMNMSFKIYVYPHKQNDPFARSLLPMDGEPAGNYASESYFKKTLMKSHFITEDPTKAGLFFLPFSIAGLRHDRRVSVGGIPNFIRDYIYNVSHNYPYWNRTGGADHFYVACHSVGRSALDKSSEAKFNIIQLVCSSSYFVPGYIAHKDASLPQIWPRKKDPLNLLSAKRKRLAFFAGAMNSPVRQELVKAWGNDSEIFVHYGRLKTPYADELLGSKFCLHAKGFEVNTARVGDSIFYGCVPVIIANHYDLPFADVLNWKSFSVVVSSSDIPLLKKILKGINGGDYSKLQSNVMKVRRHFKWHEAAREYDAFHMAMYELWLRRSLVRVPLEL